MDEGSQRQIARLLRERDEARARIAELEKRDTQGKELLGAAIERAERAEAGEAERHRLSARVGELEGDVVSVRDRVVLERDLRKKTEAERDAVRAAIRGVLEKRGRPSVLSGDDLSDIDQRLAELEAERDRLAAVVDPVIKYRAAIRDCAPQDTVSLYDGLAEHAIAAYLDTATKATDV